MIEPIQIQLLTFANQLGKLLKVIHHSDPSAEAMKKPLYKKYQQALDEFFEMNQDMVPWAEMKRLVQGLRTLDEFTLDREIGSVVLKKLTQDLQDKYTEPLELNEFTAVPPRPRPKAQRQKSVVTPPKPTGPDPELLIQMAQLDQRQQQAANSLKGMIDAINRLDPSFLEKKILSSVPRGADIKKKL